MKKYSIITITLVTLALLTACENPFVKGVMPDNTDKGSGANAKPTTFKIYIDYKGSVPGDSVTASSKSGQDGEAITLNYTLANTHINNQLDFQGTRTRVPSVARAGTGNRLYLINKEDAVEGEITITAVFTHSSKTIDSIAFADPGPVTKAYGDPTFTNAITNTGSGTGAITYDSSVKSVATVNTTTGEVTILTVGTTTITATKAGDATYEKATAMYILNVTKAAGSTVSAPTMASKTIDSITINAVTVNTTAYGQTPEYAISKTESLPENNWQEGRTFSGLEDNTLYYVFARSKENDKYKAGAARSVEIRTERAYRITINKNGNDGADSVTASPEKGIVGDTITLSYTLANTKTNNRLTFSGTDPRIEEVNSAGSGTKTYTIAEKDASDYAITILANFVHSDKTLDTIAFANTDNVTKIYGDDSSFTKAITNTGAGTGVITYSSSDQTVATVDSSTGAVTILKAGDTTITAKKAEDTTHAEATASYLLTVAKRQLGISNPVVTTTKPYDGERTAAVTPGALSNLFGTETVTVTAVGHYNSKNVADANQITVVYSISGTAAGNYSPPVDYTTSGTITKLQLTVAELVTTLKTYDGTKTAAVTINSTNKIGNDDLTVTAVGTYASENAGENINITIEYTIGGTDAGNYTAPANHTVTGTIERATGSAVSKPSPDRTLITETTIAVKAVTISTPAYGQTAEYAISSTISTVAGLTGSETWQASNTFTGLTENTIYYVFARSKESTNYRAGTAQVSVGIKAVKDDPNRRTVIDFENLNTEIIASSSVSGKYNYSYTYGTNSPEIAIVSDPGPGNSTQKSLQITTSASNAYNQAAIIPVNLSLPLSNYESLSFKFWLVSRDNDTSNRNIDVYAASSNNNAQNNNNDGFKRYAFGNPSTDGNQFADKKIGSTAPAENFSDKTGKWTEYTININPASPATGNLAGNIYIAIGINVQNKMVYLFDDITFVLKDDVATPPPSISPTTAAFDKNTGAVGYKDIDVTMTLRGRTLTSITNGGDTLTQGTSTTGDYYITGGNTVTLKKEYLATQEKGTTTTLTFNFSESATAAIAITISDTTPPAGTILSYNFSTNTPPLTAGYPKGSNGDISGTITEGVLRVTKATSNNYSTVAIYLPFSLPADKTLTNYNLTFKIRGVSATPSGDTANDYTNKGVIAYVRDYSSSVTTLTSIGSVNNITLGTTWKSPNPVISLSGSNTGAVEIGIGLGSTKGYTIEIETIELVLK